jgi:hypothetical protein
MMHGQQKSDPCTVATKPANKSGPPEAESVEPRRGAVGNMASRAESFTVRMLL